MIYCDIDGTLTDQPKKKWGVPQMERIEAIKALCKEKDVVIWSGSGREYAIAFCKKHGIEPVAALGKPRRLYDDNPEVRPGGLAQYVLPPEEIGQRP